MREKKVWGKSRLPYAKRQGGVGGLEHRVMAFTLVDGGSKEEFDFRELKDKWASGDIKAGDALDVELINLRTPDGNTVKGLSGATIRLELIDVEGNCVKGATTGKLGVTARDLRVDAAAGRQKRMPVPGVSITVNSVDDDGFVAAGAIVEIDNGKISPPKFKYPTKRR